MKTDIDGRRLRFAPPNPLQRPKKAPKRIELKEADYLLFEAIERHGPLPSHYLYAFTKHLRKDETHLKNRLTEFYNGDEGGPYLVRPPRQFQTFEARYQHVVYDLAPRAIAALEARRARLSYPKPRSIDFVHDLMAACATASIELAAKEKGVRYIDRNEILAHPSCPRATKDGAHPLSITIAGKLITPDDLFGLEYPREGDKPLRRFFWFEADRSTERIRSSVEHQSSFGRKLRQVYGVIRGKLFHERWGIPNLHALTLTTTHGRKENLVDFTKEEVDPQLAPRFGFQVEPIFGARYADGEQHWRVPRTVLSYLFDEPWSGVSGSKDIGQL